MSTVQSIASTAPIAAFAEPRVAQTAPAQSPAPAQTRAESQGRSTVADQVQINALEARDAARERAKETKAAAEQPAKYASKVGLVDGTLDAFVDIVDARFQRKIARIFGPSEAPAPAADVPPAAVSKAYEHAAETASGNLRQSA
ncbi:MAG: hypothetical protein J0H39_02285 [Alphaproteobacteria bacterium]|nr:hypothetical protein [Alphaproteobacteria bacterium]